MMIQISSNGSRLDQPKILDLRVDLYMKQWSGEELFSILTRRLPS